MNLNEQLTRTILDPVVILQAKKIIAQNSDKALIEKFEMSFRLNKVNERTVIIESMAIRPKNPNDSFSSCEIITYFKPLAIYYFTKGFLTSKTEVTLLNEAWNCYQTIKKELSMKIDVKSLTFIDNALIAAFSVEALVHANLRRDCSFEVNGIDIDLFMCFEGYQQSYLNDKYGIEGPIGAYQFEGDEYSYAPMINYKVQYDNLHKLELLSIEKML